MVTKEQIKTEFDLFGQVWTTYKRYYEPQDTDEFWDELTEEIKAIQRKFPGQLSKDLSLAILDDIERRYRGQK